MFDPLLPAYDLLNFRVGVRHGVWDVAFYVNNITDDTHLAVTRPRARFPGARGVHDGQPRTFGISTRFDF